jgi:hypothetical protein
MFGTISSYNADDILPSDADWALRFHSNIGEEKMGTANRGVGWCPGSAEGR